MLLEAYPDLTPAQVKERITSTAVDLGLDPNTQGSGRGDAYAAYRGETPPGPPSPSPPGCPAFLLGVIRGLFKAK